MTEWHGFVLVIALPASLKSLPYTLYPNFCKLFFHMSHRSIFCLQVSMWILYIYLYFKLKVIKTRCSPPRINSRNCWLMIIRANMQYRWSTSVPSTVKTGKLMQIFVAVRIYLNHIGPTFTYGSIETCNLWVLVLHVLHFSLWTSIINSTRGMAC